MQRMRPINWVVSFWGHEINRTFRKDTDTKMTTPSEAEVNITYCTLKSCVRSEEWVQLCASALGFTQVISSKAINTYTKKPNQNRSRLLDQDFQYNYMRPWDSRVSILQSMSTNQGMWRRISVHLGAMQPQAKRHVLRPVYWKDDIYLKIKLMPQTA